MHSDPSLWWDLFGLIPLRRCTPACFEDGEDATISRLLCSHRMHAHWLVQGIQGVRFKRVIMDEDATDRSPHPPQEPGYKRVVFCSGKVGRLVATAMPSLQGFGSKLGLCGLQTWVVECTWFQVSWAAVWRCGCVGQHHPGLVT